MIPNMFNLWENTSLKRANTIFHYQAAFRFPWVDIYTQTHTYICKQNVFGCSQFVWIVSVCIAIIGWCVIYSHLISHPFPSFVFPFSLHGLLCHVLFPPLPPPPVFFLSFSVYLWRNWGICPIEFSSIWILMISAMWFSTFLRCCVSCMN